MNVSFSWGSHWRWEPSTIHNEIWIKKDRRISNRTLDCILKTWAIMITGHQFCTRQLMRSLCLFWPLREFILIHEHDFDIQDLFPHQTFILWQKICFGDADFWFFMERIQIEEMITILSILSPSFSRHFSANSHIFHVFHRRKRFELIYLWRYNSILDIR